MPQELTQRKMGKIVRDRYPDLSAEDQAAVRQHAISAFNLTQKAKAVASGLADVGTERSKTALIDSINPCDAAYAVLAQAMNETVLQYVQSVITAKIKIPPEDARELAKRALRFKKARGPLPEITSQDGWEKRLAEGVAAFARHRAQAAAHG